MCSAGHSSKRHVEVNSDPVNVVWRGVHVGEAVPMADRWGDGRVSQGRSNAVDDEVGDGQPVRMARTDDQSAAGRDERVPVVWGSGARTPSATVRGDVVFKPAGPWCQAVIDLLHHLERVGFTGAPHVVEDGLDEHGRLMVQWVEGTSPHPQAWTDEGAARVGVLLRELHDATKFYVPPASARWQATWLRDVRADDVVLSHCDTGPWNVVGRNGSPQALIDWEYAGPVARDVEVAQTAWLNAQLHDDDIAELHGLPDADGRARQLRSILDGYGIPSHRRASLVDLMIEVAVHGARAEAVSHSVSAESTAAVAADGYPVMWGIAWRARSASWMLRHQSLLRRAV